MPSNPIATFDTSKGTFKAELFLDKTPVTASNFVDLAKTGFYDGLHFHRVIEGFMLVRARCDARDARETRKNRTVYLVCAWRRGRRRWRRGARAMRE